MWWRSDDQTMFDSLLDRFLYQLNLPSFTWLDYLDVALVTIVIYALISLLRRSQVAFILRGIVVLGGLLLLANLLLPLPTFGMFLTVAAIATLVTIPIILQPELRRWLEKFGRRFGFSVSGSESEMARTVAQLTRAAENLSDSKTGALIAVEGDMPLTDIIATGIPINGELTAELLQTIFYDKGPLHDGAVVARGDSIEAAGCVLPLTERELHGYRRLGTRHRAAVGLSELSDALLLVVSEETGRISVALDGKLIQGLDRAALHQYLTNFYTGGVLESQKKSWQPWTDWHFRLPSLSQFLADLFYLGLSLVLALIATTAVRAQNNPIVETRINGVTLLAEGLPDDATLLSPLPRTVDVLFQTASAELPSISAASFLASVDLAAAQPGLNRLPVVLTTTAERVNVLRVEPSELDVNVAAIISKEMPVTVQIEDADTLSTAYEVIGDGTAVPDTALITGAQPDVDRVTVVVARMSIANATSSVSGQRDLAALDERGREVTGLTLDPAQVDVTVLIRRRINARDVGVRVVTEGAPPEGFWLSGLNVVPASVTIQGNPNALAEIGSFVDTLPVDLSTAVGETILEAPLVLPSDVQAVDATGKTVNAVTVTAQVSARNSDLLVERVVEVINDRGAFGITIEPQTVQLLLSGPLPTLTRIEAEPDLVRVVIDAQELVAGESVEVAPRVIAPEDIRVQLVETAVLVTTAVPEPDAAP